jgi:hypothetical protein
LHQMVARSRYRRRCRLGVRGVRDPFSFTANFRAAAAPPSLANANPRPSNLPVVGTKGRGL